ncbi:peptide chain release factor N(5)-glutamine methyltransferase [Flavobacterium sp. NKUCC04_CG]|uniref:peptide chain release factor N(5)-glutamine methyltransferase n=1 Tax=Flavobacterium sp. NKUCC04_CG TaxID=2842121 RepID=UPI001C5BC25B|nr:peptide chain release factor N(5)-glutamine methyltransferase [Flavobacterium sp. NKUCC04_CG]MBW3519368.1 peptide chain release factor N(5)-glutamine methyltransferase [Flavobacterium sp. NKUCC04_CG]
MKLKNLKNQFIETLKDLFEPEEIDVFFYRCLERLEQKTKIDLVLNPDLETDDVKLVFWKRYLNELKQERPLQYVLREAFFYDLTFYVEEGVLIPRPETEELVEWILQTVPKDKEIRILDIGTGSGCIAITLAKKLPLARVFAMDVSDKALVIAAKNAVLNGVEITWMLENVLELEALAESYDVIVSNPPYVRELEKVEIHNNVKQYEPELALFVSDEDPLVFYRKIAQLASLVLVDQGYLFFEINQYLGKDTVALVDLLGFVNIQLKQDFRSNDRMIRAQKRLL